MIRIFCRTLLLTTLLLFVGNQPTAVGGSPPFSSPDAPTFSPGAQATGTRRVNAPYFSGELEWAQSAIFWLGKNEQGVPSRNFTDVRVAYTAEALRVRVTVVDYYLWYKENPTATDDLTQYDAVVIYLDTDHDRADMPQTDDYTFLVGARHWPNENAPQYHRQARGTGAGWDTTWTGDWTDYEAMQWWCNPGPNSNECGIDFGWMAILTIPWETLGLSGQPADGTQWGLGVQVYDRDQSSGSPLDPEVWPEAFSAGNPATWGELAFNPPAYEPPVAVVEGTATMRQGLNGIVEDAWLGGGGNCIGGHNGGSEINHGDSGDLFTGSETAMTHFPCFNKSYLRFSLDDVPPGKVIVSATLTLHLWGNAGSSGEAQASWVHLYTVPDSWGEMTIHWNNAPLPRENIAVRQVNPYNKSQIEWPGDPYTWDATQAVAEAYAEGQPVSVALYASDSAQHSNKYYVGSESTIEDGRPTLTVTWGHAVADLQKTATPSFGDQGGAITYALNFLGTGNTLTLTDTLPVGVSAPGSFTLEGTSIAPTYEGGQHRLTWSASPLQGQKVTIRYPVTITTGSRQALVNTAELSEAGGGSSTATATVLANPDRIYLPLALKGQ